MSNEAKHTPGPWTIVEDGGLPSSAAGEKDHGGFQIDAPGITQLAYVWRANKRWGDNPEPFGAEEAEANARLIAAAPDLLEALREAASFQGECPLDLREDDPIMCSNPPCDEHGCMAAKAEKWRLLIDEAKGEEA